MTAQELIEEVWLHLGKPTNYSPRTSIDDPSSFDITSVGAVQLLVWINRAYRQATGIKTGRGHIVRFRDLIDHAFYAFPVISGTVVAGAAQTITLDSNAGAAASSQDDRYNGWLINLRDGQEFGYVVDYDGTTRVATVHKAWSTNPAAANTYTVSKSFFHVVESGTTFASDHLVVADARTILGVRDLKQDRALSPPNRTADLPLFIEEEGADPSLFHLRGKRVYLDIAVNTAAKYFDVEILKWPTALVGVTDAPVIPENWQQLIILGALWWGLRSRFEWDGAYATRKDAETLAATLVPDDVMETEFEGGQIVPAAGPQGGWR